MRVGCWFWIEVPSLGGVMGDKRVDESSNGLLIVERDDALGDTGRWVETLYRDSPGDGSVKLRVWVGDFWVDGIPGELIREIHDAVFAAVSRHGL